MPLSYPEPTAIPSAMSKLPRRRPSGATPRRPKQSGRALERILGGRGVILFPDGGARTLKVHIKRFATRAEGGFGGHMNGRHKRG